MSGRCSGHGAGGASDVWPADLPPPVADEPLPGGWVCDTRRARLADGREVVVKRSPYPADTEAEGLRALADAGVPVPDVLSARGNVLVLALVRGTPDWPLLGRAVAALHRTAGPAYGWHRDNRAGRFVQHNGWLTDWPTFYAEHRVRAYLGDPAVPADLRDRLHRACDGPLPALLPTSPPPVLTHGDLHAGNVVDGRWVVDPEVSYADRELDLAYMHASDSLPPPFWAAYERGTALRGGYDAGVRPWSLHHLLLQIRHFEPERFRPGVEGVLDRYGW